MTHQAAQRSEPSDVRLVARNISHDSNNKIHDNAVARKLGFEGGLVPGAELFGYMARVPVARWGLAWLRGGSMGARFRRPIYEGATVDITSQQGADDGIVLAASVDGSVCATGTAASGRSSRDAFASRRVIPRHLPGPPDSPPVADAVSLAPGTWLSARPFAMGEFAVRYLEQIRETEPLYTSERVVHPGILIRLCNRVISDNVVLGPWIHTASTLDNYSLAPCDGEYLVSGEVVANYERNDHRYVEVDVAIHAGATTLVARVLHTAIYQLSPRND